VSFKTKDFSFELKGPLADEGKFTGRASVYGNVDHHNDIVMPGAFTKSLAKKGYRVPVLNQHDSHDPIGLALLEDSADALIVKEGELILELPSAKDAFVRMKHALLSGISIGYNTIRESYNGSIRQLHEIELHEVSLVTFPANDMARVTSMKDAFDALFRAHPEFRALDHVLNAELARVIDDAQAAREEKAGRVISAANRALIKSAMEAMESCKGVLEALYAIGADEDAKHVTADEVKGIFGELRGALGVASA
jgi:uncharacterized protein